MQNPELTISRWMTRAQAARHFSISVSTLDRLRKHGDLPTIYLPGRAVYFDRQALGEWAMALTTPKPIRRSKRCVVTGRRVSAGCAYRRDACDGELPPTSRRGCPRYDL